MVFRREQFLRLNSHPFRIKHLVCVVGACGRWKRYASIGRCVRRQEGTGKIEWTKRYSYSLIPTVRIAHFDHRVEDRVPRFPVFEHRVGEHAAVPTDVFKFLGHLAGIVTHPIPGIARNVQFPVRVSCEAMLASLVV